MLEVIAQDEVDGDEDAVGGEAEHVKTLLIRRVRRTFLEWRMACGKEDESVHGETLQHLSGD